MDKNFSSSPYGEGSPKRNDQQNVLSAVLRGALGLEEPGSVLDARTAGLKEANSKANLVSILSDLVPGKGAIGAAPALAGALRRGGRPDLFLSHGANAGSLMKNGKLLLELTHPSFAITKNKPNAPWGDVMFIPREGKFDPRTTSATLHDRDAWTHSYNDSAFLNNRIADQVSQNRIDNYEKQLENPQYNDPNMPFPIETPAQARLSDKFEHRWEKGGLNQTGSGDAVLGVNRFATFKAFEKAKIGGPNRLGGGTEVDQKYFDYLRRLADDPTTPATNKVEALQMLLRNDPSIAHRAKGQKAGQVLMKLLRQSPADYAELKVFGHVPLSADNFAGVLAKEGTDASVIQALRDRGLYVREYDPYGYDILQDHSVMGKWADELQELSRQSMTPGATLRKTPIQFNDNLPPEWDTWSLAEKANWANKNPPKSPVVGGVEIKDDWLDMDPVKGFGPEALTPLDPWGAKVDELLAKPIDTGIPPGGFAVPDIWGGKPATKPFEEGWLDDAGKPTFKAGWMDENGLPKPTAKAPPKIVTLSDMLKAHFTDAPKPKTLHEEFDFHVNPDDASVYVTRKGHPLLPNYENAVAWLGAEKVPGGKFWPEDVMVNKEYQKKGIATEMYQQMVDAGLPIAKSNDVTKEGEAMWAAWHKKGLAKNNEFIGKPKAPWLDK